MKKYIFKLKDVEEEFFPVEISNKMKDFLEAYEEIVMAAETEEHKIYYLDSILEDLQESASFERNVSDGVMGEYGSLRDLFYEYEDFAKKTNCEFIGIKK